MTTQHEQETLAAFLERKLCSDVCGLIYSFLAPTDLYGSRGSTASARAFSDREALKISRLYWREHDIWDSAVLNETIISTDSRVFWRFLVREVWKPVSILGSALDLLLVEEFARAGCLETFKFIMSDKFPGVRICASLAWPWCILFWRHNDCPLGQLSQTTIRVRDLWQCIAESGCLPLAQFMDGHISSQCIPAPFLVLHSGSPGVADFFANRTNDWNSKAFVELLIGNVRPMALSWEKVLPIIRHCMRRLGDNERVDMMWDWGFRTGGWEPLGNCLTFDGMIALRYSYVPPEIASLLRGYVFEDYKEFMIATGKW
jgi:hypothetical protein